MILELERKAEITLKRSWRNAERLFGYGNGPIDAVKKIHLNEKWFCLYYITL